jgi:hypothetical protein
VGSRSHLDALLRIDPSGPPAVRRDRARRPTQRMANQCQPWRTTTPARAPRRRAGSARHGSGKGTLDRLRQSRPATDRHRRMDGRRSKRSRRLHHRLRGNAPTPLARSTKPSTSNHGRPHPTDPVMKTTAKKGLISLSRTLDQADPQPSNGGWHPRSSGSPANQRWTISLARPPTPPGAAEVSQRTRRRPS